MNLCEINSIYFLIPYIQIRIVILRPVFSQFHEFNLISKVILKSVLNGAQPYCVLKWHIKVSQQGAPFALIYSLRYSFILQY